MLFIVLHLRGKPLLVKVQVRIRLPVSCLLYVIGDPQAPLADDSGPVDHHVVVTRGLDVAIFGHLHSRIPFEIAVVVVGSVVVVRQVLVGIPGAPGAVHHLDMQVVFSVDAQRSFHFADGLLFRYLSMTVSTQLNKAHSRGKHWGNSLSAT